jgi:hypothetical protein
MAFYGLVSHAFLLTKHYTRNSGRPAAMEGVFGPVDGVSAGIADIVDAA